MNHKPPMLGVVLLLLFVVGLLAINVAVFLMLPFSAALAFSLLLDGMFVALAFGPVQR